MSDLNKWETPRFGTPPVYPPSGKKKTNKHKHFRRDGVQDKQEPSLGQMGPLPGTKWDPSLGQTGLSLFNSTVKSPFCPVCPWDGWGFVPGTIVPQGPSEKWLCFMFIGFFCSQESALFSRVWGSPTVRNLEILNLLWERFRGVSGLVPDFTPEMLNRTRGTSKKKQHKLKLFELYLPADVQTITWMPGHR